MIYGYQSTFKILAVASRDCEQIGFIQTSRDGSIKCVIWGDENKPEKEGRVRMKMPFCGLYFTPLKDDPRGKTQVIQTLDCFLGGNLPAWISSKAIAQTYNGHLLYRKLIPKYLKKVPDAQTKPMIE